MRPQPSSESAPNDSLPFRPIPVKLTIDLTGERQVIPTFHKLWPTHPAARFVLIGLIWFGVNILAVLGFEFYEAWSVAKEFDIPLHVVCEFESRSVSIETTPGESLAFSYRFRPPPRNGNHKCPLVIVLHGSGRRGNENVQQLRGIPARLCQQSITDEYRCAVLAPQCPAGLSWSSSIDADTDLLAVVLQMVDDICQDKRIDLQRIYLVGYSMGGFGAWDLASYAPDRFAAVVPIAGGGDPSRAGSLIDLPIWAIHGADDDVVPAALSRDMIEAIREAGGQPNYSELPNTAHNSWPSLFDHDTGILEWLFQQRSDGQTGRD